MFPSIYNTKSYAGASYEDNHDDDTGKYGKQVNIDASKRGRDDRLHKVMSQFSENSSDRKKLVGKRYEDEDENDEDDDIVTMMDKMNR